MKRCQEKPQVARISHDYFASFSSLDSDVTEEVKTTLNIRLKFRLSSKKIERDQRPNFYPPVL